MAVPPQRAQNSVRKFEAFTKDLLELVQWLVQCGVQTVAMEATAVYWIPLYQLLEDAKIKVYLVNARHVKNVPGRKSDVRDCQWLQYLLSVGLLRGSFSPAQAVCAARSRRVSLSSWAPSSYAETPSLYRARQGTCGSARGQDLAYAPMQYLFKVSGRRLGPSHAKPPRPHT